jgi:hypothetical protein
MAVSLFSAFNEEEAVGSGRQLLHLFAGHDVERWLLKILCGLVYSKSLPIGDEPEVSLPREWLEILFGPTDFPADQGLYICTVPGHRVEGPSGLKLQAIANSAGRIMGLGVWVCGFELILSMSGFRSRKFDGRTVAYRPLELYVTGPAFEKSIIFSWRGSADLGTLSLEIS